MTLKVRRDRIVAMSKPLLYRLHRDTVRKQKTGTRMSQIMETQMTESLFGNDIVKTACHIFGRDQHAVVVTADKALKLPVE